MPSHETADKMEPLLSSKLSMTMVRIFKMLEKIANEAAARDCCVKEAAKLMAIEKRIEKRAKSLLKPLIDCIETEQSIA